MATRQTASKAMPKTTPAVAAAAARAKTEAAKPAKSVAKPIKLPKSLAEVADLLYTTQQERYALNKQVDALQAIETAAREHLINNLPKSKASGIAGKVARASVETKTVVQVSDWDQLQAYVVKNYKKNPGVFALLQKRVGDAAVKEMWAAGVEVPGVKPLDIPAVSLNKL